MKPEILKIEDESNAALLHVVSLMDASSGSAGEEEIGLWSLLVERYE